MNISIMETQAILRLYQEKLADKVLKPKTAIKLSRLIDELVKNYLSFEKASDEIFKKYGGFGCIKEEDKPKVEEEIGSLPKEFSIKDYSFGLDEMEGMELTVSEIMAFERFVKEE